MAELSFRLVLVVGTSLSLTELHSTTAGIQSHTRIGLIQLFMKNLQSHNTNDRDVFLQRDVGMTLVSFSKKVIKLSGSPAGGFGAMPGLKMNEVTSS